MERAIADDKVVAILPFDVSIDAKKLPKGVTIETIRDQEKDLGYAFQSQMQTRFLARAAEYHVEFQDVERTNALLRKDSIDYDNIKEYTKDELAKLLKVDAVISGTARLAQPMSVGASIAVGILTGYSGATNSVDVTLSIHDGTDAKLLWKYSHTYSGGLGSSPESLTKELMRHIARKFPYRRRY